MIPLQVTTIDDEFPGHTRRELARCAKAGHQAVGELYAQKLLPEHFQVGARSVFGYAARTEKWLRRKERMFQLGAIYRGRKVIAGRNQDLVLTGALREEVTRSAQNNIRAFPSRVTITMRVNKQDVPYFTLRARSGGTARLAREILSDSPRHLRLLGEAFDRGFEAELANLRRARRLRRVTKTAA